MTRRNLLLAMACTGVAPVASSSGVSAESAFSANFDGMRLRDQEDRPFRWSSLEGKVALFNFVFTGCSTVCPLQTRVLADVQQELSGVVLSKVRFVSVSLDPLADSPAALKAFAQRMGVDLRHWSFVTGRPEDVDRLAERLRLFRAASGVRKPDDHATALWLVDRRGRLAQRYHGNPPDGRRLREELTAFAGL